METTNTWSLGKKILFRFIFIYLILYTFPFPLTIIGSQWLSSIQNQLWIIPISWVGKHILAIEYDITVFPNGSGDTTFNYVQVFIFFLVALTGTIMWSLLDRKRPNYEKLFSWLTVYTRYFLAIVMLDYGFAKVIKTQFPFPFPDRLLQPVGDLSPMGLLWTFMGYSKAYNIFVGLGEVVGGFLLFFRRTTLPGAMLLSVVLINVVMMNFTYDVPVKLYSSHLFFMSLFLMAPHASRLRVLIFPPDESALSPVRQDVRIAKVVFKIIFVGFVVVTPVINVLNQSQQLDGMYFSSNQKGIYNVDTFVLRGDTIPPLLNNNVRWRRVLLTQKDWAAIEYMDGVKMSLPFVSDTTLHTITIGKGYTYNFNYTSVDSTHQLWRGLMGSDSLKVVLEKKGLDFPLANRRFHWINEYPN